MALQNVITLGIDDVAHCVKVDDAAPRISEGLHPGIWSVGLAVSGNEFGATWEEYLSLIHISCVASSILYLWLNRRAMRSSFIINSSVTPTSTMVEMYLLSMK